MVWELSSLCVSWVQMHDYGIPSSAHHSVIVVSTIVPNIPRPVLDRLPHAFVVYPCLLELSGLLQIQFLLDDTSRIHDPLINSTMRSFTIFMVLSVTFPICAKKSQSNS